MLTVYTVQGENTLAQAMLFLMGGLGQGECTGAPAVQDQGADPDRLGPGFSFQGA